MRDLCDRGSHKGLVLGRAYHALLLGVPVRTAVVRCLQDSAETVRGCSCAGVLKIQMQKVRQVCCSLTLDLCSCCPEAPDSLPANNCLMQAEGELLDMQVQSLCWKYIRNKRTCLAAALPHLRPDADRAPPGAGSSRPGTRTDAKLAHARISPTTTPSSPVPLQNSPVLGQALVALRQGQEGDARTHPLVEVKVVGGQKLQRASLQASLSASQQVAYSSDQLVTSLLLTPQANLVFLTGHLVVSQAPPGRGSEKSRPTLRHCKAPSRSCTR